MKTNHINNVLLLLMSMLLLLSCSSSSSSGGGTGGTGIISRGSISQFGSIVVNGTIFDTSDADIVVGGEEVGIGDAAVQQNLDIGRVVTVMGIGSEDGENGVADRVIYRNDVRGSVTDVQDIETELKEISVLGQAVKINTVTRFKGTSFDTLAIDDMVEISGYYDDTGTIWATFLEEVIAEPNVEVVGWITNLNDALQMFEINDLTVDFSSADTSMLPGGMPAEGLLVEIEGTWDSASETMAASEIKLADELDVDDVGQIEVMGFVTGFTSIYEFVVGNQHVQVNTGVEVVDGTLQDIEPGVKLEAEGTLAGGILYAHEIEFWEPDQIEVEDIVTYVFSNERFYVGNQEVVTGVKTVYEDGNPEDIAVGVNVEIKGRLSNGILYADKVSFEQE